eukprot:15473824-Alexandrium_andersonii.AAC.1
MCIRDRKKCGRECSDSFAKACLPRVRRSFGCGSEGGPVSLSGGDLPLPAGRVGHSGAAGAPT